MIYDYVESVLSFTQIISYLILQVMSPYTLTRYSNIDWKIPKTLIKNIKIEIDLVPESLNFILPIEL